MPNLASLVFKPLSGGISAATKIAGSSPGARTAYMAGIGAGVGGIAGAAGGHDINSALEGAMRGAGAGALAGVGAGMAINPLTYRGAYQGAKGALNWSNKTGLSSMMGTGMKKLGSAAMYAAERPGATAAVLGGAYGALQLSNMSSHNTQDFSNSPTLEGGVVNANYNQQAMAAAELEQIGGGVMGSAPQMMERFQYANWMQTVGSIVKNTPGGRMASSTANLVQGLHSGRHG